MTNVKIATIGILAALGLSSAALAQKADAPHSGMTAEQHQKMMSGMGQAGSGNMMMKHAEMEKMMAGCAKMMQTMGDKSALAKTSETPQKTR